MLDRFTADELRQAIDGADTGFWVWDLNADEVRWSRQLGNIYGVEPADFPGNSAELSAMLPPSVDAQLTAAIVASAQSNGRFHFEHQIIRQNNQSAWVRYCGRVESNENNDPAKVCAIAIDITKQRLAEQSLQEREEHFRRFSELTSDYIFEVDLSDQPLVPQVVAGSYDRIVGYTADELTQKGGWTSIMLPEDVKTGTEVWKLLENGVPTVHEYRIVNKQGEIRWLRDHSHPVVANGKLIKIIGGVMDITKTKSLESQLLQAKKHEAMAHLSGAVAHDFNNLLFVVSATAELMPPTNEDIESLKNDIILACDRGAELTLSLLAFTRKDLPQPRTIHLAEAIGQSKIMLQRAVGEQIKVRAEHSNYTNDKVDIDPGQLQLVLLTLATNARAAISAPGEFVLSISTADSGSTDIPEMTLGETVVLTVTDSGNRIPDKTHLHGFHPFFTTALAIEGSNMGLATCWQIIERAGGTIRVNSTMTPGTTFSIYLPAVKTPVHTEPKSSARYSIGGKEHILLVQSDANVRKVSERILRLYGYTVSGVNSTRAARQSVAENHFDMLLIDLADSDGIDLIGKLGRINPDLPTLLISDYIDEQTRSRLKADGFNFLPKPFSTAILARSVRATLSR